MCEDENNKKLKSYLILKGLLGMRIDSLKDHLIFSIYFDSSFRIISMRADSSVGLSTPRYIVVCLPHLVVVE